MNPLALFTFLLMLVAILGCNTSQVEEPDQAAVRIGGKAAYSVDMAITPAEHQQGLSGREFMAQDTGMLFVFEDEQPRYFWMKDMRFPLDIIWIDGQCRLAGVSANVPTPPPNADDADIPRAPSQLPARYVLELNAGEWERAGLSAGDAVEFLGPIANSYGC